MGQEDVSGKARGSARSRVELWKLYVRLQGQFQLETRELDSHLPAPLKDAGHADTQGEHPKNAL